MALFRDQTLTPQEAEQEFDVFLRERILEERKIKTDMFLATTQPTEKERLRADLLKNSEFLELIGKPSLDALLSSDLRQMSDSDLNEFLLRFSEAYSNRLGFIHQVKNQRIVWSRTLKEILEKTKSVDPLFRSGFFEKLGGILYSSFNFDLSNQQISLNGRAKSDDGTNFSNLANLIDALEGSTFFQDVQIQNFTKRPLETGGFEGSFSVDFSIQKNATDPSDKVFSIR